MKVKVFRGITLCKLRAPGGATCWNTALQARRLWVWFPIILLEFFVDSSCRPHSCPWVNSAFNRNEYQDYLLGVKVASA